MCLYTYLIMVKYIINLKVSKFSVLVIKCLCMQLLKTNFIMIIFLYYHPKDVKVVLILPA